MYARKAKVAGVALVAAMWALSWPMAGGEEDSRSAPERVTVDVPVFEGGEGLDFFTQCAADYETQVPGVSIDLYGDPRIADKVRVRVLEGSYPDVTNAGLNYWALIRNGDILPLDEFLDGPNWENDSTWRDSFLTGSLERYTWEGKTYGIPFLYSVFAIWYNKTMFEENGWRPPTTWDEFLALCQTIEEAKLPAGWYDLDAFVDAGEMRPTTLKAYRASHPASAGEAVVHPLAFQGQYPDYAQSLIDSAYYHQVGRDGFYAQQNLEPGSFDNPQLIKALTLTQEVATKYFEPGCMGHSHTMAQQRFFNGKTAMIPCGSWLKSEMLGKIPEGFRLGAFNLPIVPGGKGDPTAVYTATSYYFVFRAAPHARQGVDFLRFMTSRAQAGKFCRMRDIVAAVKGATEGNVSEDLADLVRITNASKSAYGAAPGEGFPEFAQYWSDARVGVITGKLDPAQAARNLENGAIAVRARKANPDQITVRHVWQPLTLMGLLLAAIVYTVTVTLRGYRQEKSRGAAGTDAPRRLGLSWFNIVLFVGPAVILYTVFVVVPSLKSFVWSVNRWDGLTPMQYVGLQQFARMLFESDGFWIALRNNLYLMFVIPACVLPLSLFLATCISRNLWGSKVFRIVFFFPNILGSVAATLLWMQLYEPSGGPINRLLTAIGLDYFKGYAWTSQEHLYTALIPMSIWGACGFNMLLFLAAMESIPQSLYEAADLDGASAFRQFWTITLPLIWDVLSIAIVFMVIGGMKAFEVIWLFTNQRPVTEVHVVGTLMVQDMFTEYKVGEATAIAVLLFLMVFFGTAATLRLMRRETVEY